MKKYQYTFLLLFAFAVCTGAGAKGTETIKAGVASVNITPALPAWLTGYASRQTPAKGVLHPIWAKALVLEENKDNRIIIVTVDVLGLSNEIVQDVFKATQAKYGIRRSQLLLNSSHTHSGPMIWPCLDGIYDFSAADQQQVAEYSQKLAKDIIGVIDSAMGNLADAQLYSGHGSAGFSINRRNTLFPAGPVDQDVPVLKVLDNVGKIKAVLFGYACHNTTLVDDNYLINGDYAGFAQIKIQQDYPGATALFLMGCAGDQNPAPRGKVELAQQHGNSLAAAVEKVLNSNMATVNAPIHTDYSRVYLAYKNFDLEAYQKDIKGNDKFLQRRAKLMLEAYNKGWSVDKMSYPIQAVRFNNDLTILGMADEVVVDYSLLFKKAYPGENLYVAGYCSEVQCYIPSKRVLKEGGYEGGENMIYYGMPGPFADDVEERIIKTADQVLKNVGAKKPAEAVKEENKKAETQISKRLTGTLGTYAFPPAFANGEVDDDRLIKELKDIHANTYHWLAWGKNSGLAAFKKFLPKARKANINVWLTLVPPSESPPYVKDYSEPYRLDYEKWAEELAALSLKEPNFVAWSIDDFVHNLSLFTPEYMDKIIGKVKSINPLLAFVPCAYYEQVTAQFANDYGKYMDGVLFPYRNESVVVNLDDPSYVKQEIADIRAFFRPGFLVFLDIYATGHSSIGETTTSYVKQALASGRNTADGVLIYCHQDPNRFPEKYRVIKEGFAAKK